MLVPSTAPCLPCGCGTQTHLSQSDEFGRCDRLSSSPHLERSLVSVIRGNPSLVQTRQDRLIHFKQYFTSLLELARSAHLQCLVWITATACDRRWCSQFSDEELFKEERATSEIISIQYPLHLRHQGCELLALPLLFPGHSSIREILRLY